MPIAEISDGTDNQGNGERQMIILRGADWAEGMNGHLCLDWIKMRMITLLYTDLLSFWYHNIYYFELLKRPLNFKSQHCTVAKSICMNTPQVRKIFLSPCLFSMTSNACLIIHVFDVVQNYCDWVYFSDVQKRAAMNREDKYFVQDYPTNVTNIGRREKVKDSQMYQSLSLFFFLCVLHLGILFLLDERHSPS